MKFFIKYIICNIAYIICNIAYSIYIIFNLSYICLIRTNFMLINHGASDSGDGKIVTNGDK